jgi:hypothetical protein
MAVSNVPWWGLFSSGAAPALMVGGWTVATSLQPRPVDPVAETVSALAAVGAAERWVMTATFLAVGACYIATGLALRPAGAAGRFIPVARAGPGMRAAFGSGMFEQVMIALAVLTIGLAVAALIAENVWALLVPAVAGVVIVWALALAHDAGYLPARRLARHS